MYNNGNGAAAQKTAYGGSGSGSGWRRVEDGRTTVETRESPTIREQWNHEEPQEREGVSPVQNKELCKTATAEVQEIRTKLREEIMLTRTALHDKKCTKDTREKLRAHLKLCEQLSNQACYHVLSDKKSESSSGQKESAHQLTHTNDSEMAAINPKDKESGTPLDLETVAKEVCDCSRGGGWWRAEDGRTTVGTHESLVMASNNRCREELEEPEETESVLWDANTKTWMIPIRGCTALVQDEEMYDAMMEEEKIYQDELQSAIADTRAELNGKKCPTGKRKATFERLKKLQDLLPRGTQRKTEVDPNEKSEHAPGREESEHQFAHINDSKIVAVNPKYAEYRTPQYEHETIVKEAARLHRENQDLRLKNAEVYAYNVQAREEATALRRQILTQQEQHKKKLESVRCLKGQVESNLEREKDERRSKETLYKQRITELSEALAKAQPGNTETTSSCAAAMPMAEGDRLKIVELEGKITALQQTETQLLIQVKESHDTADSQRKLICELESKLSMEQQQCVRIRSYIQTADALSKALQLEKETLQHELCEKNLTIKLLGDEIDTNRTTSDSAGAIALSGEMTEMQHTIERLRRDNDALTQLCDSMRISAPTNARKPIRTKEHSEVTQHHGHQEISDAELLRFIQEQLKKDPKIVTGDVCGAASYVVREAAIEKSTSSQISLARSAMDHITLDGALNALTDNALQGMQTVLKSYNKKTKSDTIRESKKNITLHYNASLKESEACMGSVHNIKYRGAVDYMLQEVSDICSKPEGMERKSQSLGQPHNSLDEAHTNACIVYVCTNTESSATADMASSRYSSAMSSSSEQPSSNMRSSQATNLLDINRQYPDFARQNGLNPAAPTFVPKGWH